MSVSKREALLAARNGNHETLPTDCEFLDRKCPTLLEMLTIIPKGSTEHKTTSILLFYEDGVFKCCINDRAVGRKAWMRLVSIDETFFEDLETAVTEEHTDWRYASNENSHQYRG